MLGVLGCTGDSKLGFTPGHFASPGGEASSDNGGGFHISRKVCLVTATEATKRQRVLLVDDDVHVSKALARLLRRFCDVEIVQSIEEAQRLLALDSAFALVLCDLLLADGSGLELYRWLLSTDSPLTDKVAFMTGLGDDAPEAEEFSEVPCLGKPLDIERVRAMLGN